MGEKRTGTRSVGDKLPNGFGVFDMHGHVREWCADWFSEDYYNTSPIDDPDGASEGISRVWRGGSFNNPPDLVRSAARSMAQPTSRSDKLGFRPIQTIPFGHLTLKITEPNAIISFDNGKTTFTTPDESRLIETVLLEGKHTIEVSKTGFEPFKKAIGVVVDGQETVEVRLEPVAAPTEKKGP